MGISSTKQTDWREVEMTVDSGSCDTVMAPEECAEITIHESEQSRQGVEYEVANSETIENQGERRCMMMTENSNQAKRIYIQVADVHKPLLSVTRCADLGYECTLGKSGGKLTDIVTGESIPIRRKGNLYVMRVWIKECPFGRQG